MPSITGSNSDMADDMNSSTASSYYTASSAGSTESVKITTAAAAANVISLSGIKDLIDKADNTPFSTQRQGALRQLADKLGNRRVISALARSPAHVLHAVFEPLLRPQPPPRNSRPGGRPIFKRQKKDIKDDRSYRGESGRCLLTSFLASLAAVLCCVPGDGELVWYCAVKLLIGVSQLLTLKVDDGSQEEMALDEETARAALKMLNQCLKIPNIEDELRRVGPTILRRFWGPGGLPVGRRDEGLLQKVMLKMALRVESARALREMVEEGLAGEGEAHVRRATVNVLTAAIAAGKALLLQLRRHVPDAASSTN